MWSLTPIIFVGMVVCLCRQMSLTWFKTTVMSDHECDGTVSAKNLKERRNSLIIVWVLSWSSGFCLDHDVMGLSLLCYLDLSLFTFNCQWLALLLPLTITSSSSLSSSLHRLCCSFHSCSSIILLRVEDVLLDTVSFHSSVVITIISIFI